MTRPGGCRRGARRDRRHSALAPLAPSRRRSRGSLERCCVRLAGRVRPVGALSSPESHSPPSHSWWTDKRGPVRGGNAGQLNLLVPIERSGDPACGYSVLTMRHCSLLIVGVNHPLTSVPLRRLTSRAPVLTGQPMPAAVATGSPLPSAEDRALADCRSPRVERGPGCAGGTTQAHVSFPVARRQGGNLVHSDALRVVQRARLPPLAATVTNEATERREGA